MLRKRLTPKPKANKEIQKLIAEQKRLQAEAIRRGGFTQFK